MVNFMIVKKKLQMQNSLNLAELQKTCDSDLTSNTYFTY